MLSGQNGIGQAASKKPAHQGGAGRQTRGTPMRGLRLLQITATIGLPSGNPSIHDADLRRFQARSFRLVRSAPCHARRDAGACRRVRSAADASRRGGRQALDAARPGGLAIGQRRELGSFTFTADNIKKFAAQFDPQRFHLDEEAGRESLFGGLAASGWHVGSICMKLLVADGQRQAREMTARGEKVAVWGPSPGFRDLRGIKPVLAGDTIAYASDVESLRRSEKRPEWGILQAATLALTNAASWCSRCWRRRSCRSGMLADGQNPASIFVEMRRRGTNLAITHFELVPVIVEDGEKTGDGDG